MPRRVVFVGACALLAVGLVAGAGVAQERTFVRGEPDLEVLVPDATLTPGTTQQVTLQLSNDGQVESGATDQRELVTTARNVRVEVDAADAPVTVETGEQAIGSVGTDAPGEATVLVRAPEDLDPGEYELDVEVDYSYTRLFAPRSGATQERSRTVTETVALTVEDRPRFELRGVGTDLQVGDTGTVVAEVHNVGTRDASAVEVTVEPTSPNVVMGEPARDTARIDRLAANETATVAFDAELLAGSTTRNYSLRADVQYTDPEGIQHVDEGLSFGFRPADEQTFEVSLTASSLRVGETGAIEGTIRNSGPGPVEDVVLVLGEGQFEPRSRTYAVDDLAVGANESFAFRAVVPDGTDPVPQRIDVRTQYRTADGDDRTTVESLHVPIAERRDAVTVTAVDPQFAAGEDGTLRLSVANQRDVEMREVRLDLGVAEPLESEFQSAVIPALDPGETGEVAFDLSVDGDAPESRYPATVEVEYLDPDDEPATARPTTVAIAVTDAGADVPLAELAVGLLVVVLLVGGGWWFYGSRLA